jgi:SAM-dependent methyltransferase
MAWASAEDEGLPSSIDGVNLVLNRARLAAFLTEFADDRDVGDLLTLDVMGAAAGIPLSSTGLAEDMPSLALRPFRLWEYTWLYKSLKLSDGGRTVLDLGGPASHLSVLAALAGCQVTTIDINPMFVQAARECATALRLNTLDARVGDMRDLSELPAKSFEVVVCCSVLEHLTAADQEIAVREMARVLKPGGMIGLTFDFGLAASGANEYLPPPHDPPPNSGEALRRYLQSGLVLIGNPFVEDPISGSLFRHTSVGYTVASLFLGKTPLEEVRVPKSESGAPIVHGSRVEALPYRILRSASSQFTEVRQREDDLRCAAATIREQEQRSTALDQAFAEVLAAMHEKDLAIAQLQAELDTRAGALIAMRTQLERATATINEQHQRAAIPEQAAAERLAAMHEKKIWLLPNCRPNRMPAQTPSLTCALSSSVRSRR